jgi:hypothetical protein
LAPFYFLDLEQALEWWSLVAVLLLVDWDRQERSVSLFPNKKGLDAEQGKQNISKMRACASLAHAYNPSYSGGRDQEDQGSKPARQIVGETLS